MKKLLSVLFIAMLGAFLCAQGGISGTATVKIDTAGITALYGNLVEIPVTVDLTGVTGTGGVAAKLGGFNIPVGFDKVKWSFVSAKNPGLPGTLGSTLTFVNTSFDIANANGFGALVGATAATTAHANPVAKFTGRPFSIQDPALTVLTTAPSGFAQVKLSLSSQFVASGNGPANIPATVTASTLPIVGRIVNTGLSFDGSGRSQIAAWIPSTGTWYVKNNGTDNGLMFQCTYGNQNFVPFAGNFQNATQCNVGCFQPGTGIWYIRANDGSTLTPVTWGTTPGDVPVPADYNGDGIAEIATYNLNSGQWFVRDASGGVYVSCLWGGAGWVPVPGDFDGDGKDDICAFNSANGQWFARKADGTVLMSKTWGAAGFIPLVADFNNDGIDDIAAYSPDGKYYADIPGFTPIQWGNSNFVPFVGRYEGATAGMNMAAFEPQSGRWYVRGTDGSLLLNLIWGGPGCVAIAK